MSTIVPSQQVQNRKIASYLFWAGSFVGVCGLHRLYNGKITSGIIWMCTFGFFGIGQFVDLFLIGDMAESRQRQILGDGASNFDRQPAVAAEISRDTLAVRLLRLAKLHDGQITVTQAVMETGKSFEAIENELKTMVKAGYADITNRPDSGVVIYEFPELM